MVWYCEHGDVRYGPIRGLELHYHEFLKEDNHGVGWLEFSIIYFKCCEVYSIVSSNICFVYRLDCTRIWLASAGKQNNISTGYFVLDTNFYF
jgi:hypothetical protein